VTAAVIASLSTAKPSPEQIQGLTWSTLTPEQRKANKESYTKTDIAISLLLLALVIGVLVYFTG
jgi:SSS family solute:Na+ symporter